MLYNKISNKSSALTSDNIVNELSFKGQFKLLGNESTF